jgi:transcriptional regulator with GAF, ATPase, and Fis domain
LTALGESDETTVLVVGETGTGKSLVAKGIHAASKRAYEPFVAVDCTTIPASLVESELFGYEKGAFSGATGSKQGRVEAAGRGTLFLDEIGELDPPVQVKLLRLLEEREFTRVGGTRPRKLHARIVAATNRDLDRAVREGRFRSDLRYRLEVFVVELPTLRTLGDDINLLTRHFSSERARALGRPEPTIHRDIVRAMNEYPFPGNVRELRNMVEQAVLLSRASRLQLDDFPVLKRAKAGWHPPTTIGATRTTTPPLGAAQHAKTEIKFTRPMHGDSIERRATLADVPDSGSLEEIRRRHADRERAHLIEALERTGGNVSAAARELGISRHQASRRIAKYGLR